MTTTDKNARAAWATLTHDSLDKAKIGSSTLSKTQFVTVNFALLLGNVLVLFNTGAFASVSLHATGALGVSPSHASWFQSYYFVSLALALPVSSWFANRFGEVRLYLWALSLMAFGSLLCGTMANLGGFVFGRVLQGFFGGLTIPLSQTLLMREYPEHKKPFAVGIWSISALSPFTLGPMVGGWVADLFGWRWLFFLNLPLSLVAVPLVWALLFDRHSPRRLLPFDWGGFLLLAIALGCVQTALNQGQDEDWYNSTFIISLFALGFLALAYFIVWELAEQKPLLNLRLLARRNFGIGTFMLSISFMLMYGLLSVLLVRLQVVAGYTSFLAGSVLLPLLFLAKPMASFFHHIVHYFDPRWLASLNMLAFAAYCFWTSQYDFFNRNSFFDQTLASQVLEGFCLGGLFVPLTTIFLSGLTPKRQTQAVELGGMLRVLGGSIASPLLGTFWEHRAAFHQARLSETLSAYDSFGRDTLATLHQAGFHWQLANAKFAGITNQHAAILGLDDTFRFATWIFLALAALVWLAYPVPPKRSLTAKAKLRETALEELIEEP